MLSGVHGQEKPSRLGCHAGEAESDVDGEIDLRPVCLTRPVALDWSKDKSSLIVVTVIRKDIHVDLI